MPDLPLFETSAPERLIAGIGAGLTFWVRWEIVLVELEGSAQMPLVFSGSAGWGYGGGWFSLTPGSVSPGGSGRLML